MEIIAVSLVAIAAVLHASWNALVKTAGDRLVVLTAVAVGQGTLGLAMLPFVQMPNAESWLYIIISTVLHYFYYWFLYYAYREGDFSQVYPIVRGLAPIFVAIGAFVFVDERLSLLGVSGVIIAALGICGISLISSADVRLSNRSIIYASLTALTIAAYTVSDGIGVRLTDSPFSFIAWLFVFELPMVVFTVVIRRGSVLIALANDRWKFLGCALCSAAAYALVVYASAYIPLAIVSTIRESSVIIAALIGVCFLGERPWQHRIGMSMIVAIGVFLLSFSKLG